MQVRMHAHRGETISILLPPEVTLCGWQDLTISHPCVHACVCAHMHVRPRWNTFQGLQPLWSVTLKDGPFTSCWVIDWLETVYFHRVHCYHVTKLWVTRVTSQLVHADETHLLTVRSVLWQLKVICSPSLTNRLLDWIEYLRKTTALHFLSDATNSKQLHDVLFFKNLFKTLHLVWYLLLIEKCCNNGNCHCPLLLG